MPTLNINVSQEALDYLESLHNSIGLPKGKIVSIAISDISSKKIIETISKQSENVKPKSIGKKKLT